MFDAEDVAVIRKATVYDLKKLLEKGKTYTAEEFKALTDAYIKSKEAAKGAGE